MRSVLATIAAVAFVTAAWADSDYPPGLFENSPEINPSDKKWTHLPDGRWMFVDPKTTAPDACDFEHQCYHMDPGHPAPTPRVEVNPPIIQELPPAPRAEAPPRFIQELPPPPMAAEDDPQSCFNLRRGIFATAQAAANARAKCDGRPQ